MRGGLPPSSLGKDVNVAIFGEQETQAPQKIVTPSMSVNKILEGIKRSYALLKD